MSYSKFAIPNVAIPNVDIYQTWESSALIREFESLTVYKKRHAENIEKELKNLAIIREVAARIEKKSSRLGMHTDTSLDVSSTYSELLARPCYLLILSFGILQRAVGSYLFGSTVFLLIPHISSPVLIALSMFFVALDSLLFYAFEVSFLKSIMGIKDEQTGLGLLNQIYLEQRASAKKINRALNNVDSLEWNDHERQVFMRCKNLFNDHLLEKLNSMQAPQRSWAMGCLEYAVVAFGAFSSIVDSYFAFTVLHIAFLTPIGFIVALGMAIAGLALYYGMGVQSVNKLINPDLESFEVLQEKLSKFKAEFSAGENPSQPVSRYRVFQSNRDGDKKPSCSRKDVLFRPSTAQALLR